VAIGTSLGQWFPDALSHATQKYSGNDNNVIDPDIDPGSVRDKSKDTITQPIKVSDIEDRRDETMTDQAKALAHGLWQYGHDTIHPDPLEPVPLNPSGLAKDLGFDNIDINKPYTTTRASGPLADDILTDIKQAGGIIKGMYEGLTNPK